MQNVKDLFIIGGGINGTGIASDAAGRGLSVTLAEKNDLASGTSSHSTKLIHGGLRYLEFYEFHLVREALREREILMRKAPNLITPLKFIFPHEKHLRPAWMIRLGLFLYDHLAVRHLIPGSASLTLDGHLLKNEFKRAFSYYDCATDDARLVVLNAISAQENQAEILTHTEFVEAKRENDLWKITLLNKVTNETIIYQAKALLNAAGPWIEDVNKKIANTNTNFKTQLVKGSHIVIPKLYEEDFAFILQNADNRVVFTIPYQNDFTLIGTTDILVTDPDHIEIDANEKNYLCDTVNHYFKKSIQPTDIVWSYSGVRCLQQQNKENPSATTRDYKLLLDSTDDKTPLLTIIGGKITTFRILAEDVLKKLTPFFKTMGPSWTQQKPLPGGNFINQDFKLFYSQFRKDYPWLPETLAKRYAKNYGSRVNLFLQNTQTLTDLGENFGAGLYEKEVAYLMQHEWARTVEDILWRRTKLGLHLKEINREKLEQKISCFLK